MSSNKFICYLIVTIALIFNNTASAQLPFGLQNGIDKQIYCSRCQQTIADKPEDVLFGLDIHDNGDIYFSINNKEWFDKIFASASYGVTTDLVSKDRYNCNISKKYSDDFIRGTLIQPVYKPALIDGDENLLPGVMYVKIGKVPPQLRNKELEGNLVIVNGNLICYYTNFVNIARNALQLLPMGLFTDSLVNTSGFDENSEESFFTYSKKLQFEIPFEKNKTIFKSADLTPLYDSLKLNQYSIKKIEIRAYSSVEGSLKVNEQLMNGRAQSLLSALKEYQPLLNRTKIISAENWIEFFDDIQKTNFSDLADLSKFEIKKKLIDKRIADSLEVILAKERKVSILLFVEKKGSSKYSGSGIIDSFNLAVKQKDINKARIIQKELIDDIADNKQPLEYLNRLEIPAEKDFSSLLNDREVYKYLLKVTSEYEALQNFLDLKKIDSVNGKINYNICALIFFTWQFGGDSAVGKYLLSDIRKLNNQRIDSSLVKRMEINFHILKCEEYNQAYKYDKKDEALNFIKENYPAIRLTDEDIYSLAKYFGYYARFDWAEELIEPRVNKIDVSEDLVFYYLNLLFFHFSEFGSPKFKSAVLNAVNLNRQRYCNFFLPHDRGGASMQLLEYEELKELYCENCNK